MSVVKPAGLNSGQMGSSFLITDILDSQINSRLDSLQMSTKMTSNSSLASDSPVSAISNQSLDSVATSRSENESNQNLTNSPLNSELSNQEALSLMCEYFLLASLTKNFNLTDHLAKLTQQLVAKPHSTGSWFPHLFGPDQIHSDSTAESIWNAYLNDKRSILEPLNQLQNCTNHLSWQPELIQRIHESKSTMFNTTRSQFHDLDSLMNVSTWMAHSTRNTSIWPIPPGLPLASPISLTHPIGSPNTSPTITTTTATIPIETSNRVGAKSIKSLTIQTPLLNTTTTNNKSSNMSSITTTTNTSIMNAANNTNIGDSKDFNKSTSMNSLFGHEPNLSFATKSFQDSNRVGLTTKPGFNCLNSTHAECSPNSALDALIHMTTSTMQQLKQNSDNSGDDFMDSTSASFFHKSSQSRKRRKTRTTFSNSQLSELENNFNRQKYLTPSDRDRIAKHLGLTNTQVITWFQNRRAKLKREAEELERDIMALRQQEERKLYEFQTSEHGDESLLSSRSSEQDPVEIMTVTTNPKTEDDLEDLTIPKPLNSKTFSDISQSNKSRTLMQDNVPTNPFRIKQKIWCPAQDLEDCNDD